MKKIQFILFFVLSIFLMGCREDKSANYIKFAISAEYPPFEYHDGGEIKGFDIDLARLIAKKLNKEARFEDMQFSTILPAIQSQSVDAAISTITITEERKQSFDFSDSYYRENLAIIYSKSAPLTTVSSLAKKKIACQLGTTMEIWLKKHAKGAEIVVMDHNNQAIEALKAGHVDGVLIDNVQAIAFTQKNHSLFFTVIAKADNGYGIAVKKGSLLTTEFNNALKLIEENGELNDLKNKWFQEVK